jgi:hypothetical protein
MIPISKPVAIRAASWLKRTFGADMAAAGNGTPFSVDLMCGIACKETAVHWVNWINDRSADEILSLCVFDASGDYPGTRRSAFPRDTAAFRARYDEPFTAMLIEEANRARRVRHLADAQWVYKGYGIFQYDLQHVTADESFFRDKQWYRFAPCLDRLMRELGRKWTSSGHDLWKTIKAYNGSGSAATEYANDVTQLTSYCAEAQP